MLKKAKNLIFKYRAYILGIFGLGLVWDIFFNQQISDLAVLILVILWILSIFSFRLEPKIGLILAALSYAVSFIFQFFNQEMIMEKGASWFFVFLLISLVQSFIKSE
ncbi:hypothetical protein COU95_00050 [Candidatus Shapirobacteria bacterium CG10_big_fil_rev_8_21_14_0_10_40_9]|uniref:Histidine kinase n=1 Tax=Candidatus Shapirobacteria bacterium CG10_big_fil_rev_8_21_14_0_10_40_9 TaxID=1974888 RepID=A0A2M8L4K3_9BACT|nr:MAG: hypothetical protein COU95_00050 [Candidatus Shapirobacteria bacterium CG10_big_fil_rev_8_21_14_0_10_40_9]